MRADVLTLAARKLQGSPAVEVMLPKDGLEIWPESLVWEMGLRQ